MVGAAFVLRWCGEGLRLAAGRTWVEACSVTTRRWCPTCNQDLCASSACLPKFQMAVPFQRTGMHQLMFKQGTFCYVVPSCRASPRARRAVSRIVEVIGGPYERPRDGSRMTCYDVRHQDLVLYCQADKLRAINDPDADVGEPQDGTLAM
jgi:hypothetical protein